MKRSPDDPESPSKRVDAMLGELRGSGSAEASTFTVDSAAAREKLERHRLADPATYSLSLVQAAVLAKADQVTCHCADGSFEIRFDGDPFLLALRVARPKRRSATRDRRILAEGRHAAGNLAWHDTTEDTRDARAGKKKAIPGVKITAGPLIGRFFRLSTPPALRRAIRKLFPRQVEVYVDEGRARAVLPPSAHIVSYPTGCPQGPGSF